MNLWRRLFLFKTTPFNKDEPVDRVCVFINRFLSSPTLLWKTRTISSLRNCVRKIKMFSVKIEAAVNTKPIFSVPKDSYRRSMNHGFHQSSPFLSNPSQKHVIERFKRKDVISKGSNVISTYQLLSQRRVWLEDGK